MIRFGVHCSLRDGLTGALEEAHRLGCEAMQIFTRSPRMWKMKPPLPGAVAEFNFRRNEMDIYPLVVHTPYLPNLATSDPALYRSSKTCLREDITLSEQLNADYLVIHPGSYSPDSTPEAGIENVSAAINEVLAAVPGKTVILLENAAGGGRRLAGTVQELAAMMKGIKDKERIGICFDTAHALAAGFDLATPQGIDAALDEYDRGVGLENLKILHCNDSLAPLGSKRDRHQHLGKGCVGQKGFKYLIKCLNGVAEAGILETPKDSEKADERNLRRLFSWRKAVA